MKEQTIELGTLKRVRGSLEHNVLPTIGKTRLMDITAPDAILDLTPHDSLTKPVKTKQLKRCISLIKQVLDWCVNGVLMPVNPCSQVGKFFLKKSRT